MSGNAAAVLTKPAFRKIEWLERDIAVERRPDGDIALQPFDLAKGRLCQNRGCIPTHVSSPKPLVSYGPVFLSSDINRLSPFHKGSDALFIVVPAKKREPIRRADSFGHRGYRPAYT